jgi:hypothetical protein
MNDMSAYWDDDDRLLAALKEALREAEEVPPAFVQAGKSVFAWHNIDAELAELTYDSASSPDPAPALTRAEPAHLRALTCVSAELTIELEITEDTLLGQVVPAYQGEIDLHTASQHTRTETVDEIGCFTIHPIPTEPFRLHYRSGDTSVLTTWITL